MSHLDTLISKFMPLFPLCYSFYLQHLRDDELEVGHLICTMQ